MKRILVLGLIGMMLFSSLAFADEYIVKEDDKLWKIAEDNHTTVEDLVEENDIKDPNMIYVNQVLTMPQETLTNKEKSVAVIESLGTDNLGPIAYINPNKYIQHNLGVADGLEGFGALVSILPEDTTAKNIRVFEEGDYVFMHNEYNFFGPKVGFDIFRFEDGLIVEHWDNLASLSSEMNPSGRSQLDGTTILKDIDKTDENKQVVRSFVEDVLMGAAPEKITDYVSSDKYFQHNTGVADGLDGLGSALQALAEAGMPMVYTENHMILAEGNFVLAVSEGEFLGEYVSFYDLFRLEEGKIVEHWDVIEEIPAESEWKNTNGKF